MVWHGMGMVGRGRVWFGSVGNFFSLFREVWYGMVGFGMGMAGFGNGHDGVERLGLVWFGRDLTIFQK